MSEYKINNEKQLEAYTKIRDDIDRAIRLYQREQTQTVDLAEEARKPLYNEKDIYIVQHYVKGSNHPRGELFINYQHHWPFF
jgi:hypothetical protein